MNVTMPCENEPCEMKSECQNFLDILVFNINRAHSCLMFNKRDFRWPTAGMHVKKNLSGEE